MSDERTRTDDAVRAEIEGMLAGGLETEVWPRASDSELVNQIVARLRTEAAGDLSRKLVISGFADHAIQVEDMAQSCETCMYFQIHRRHCELPELELAVKPEWSCRLWRI